MGFLAPIFFAGIGLEFNISSISNLPLLLAVVLVSYFSKILGGWLGGRLAGLNSRVSLTLGIGLNARGNYGAGYSQYRLQSRPYQYRNFSILVLMGILTTLTTIHLCSKVPLKGLKRGSCTLSKKIN